MGKEQIRKSLTDIELNNRKISFWCRHFGHKWSYGHWWYPWGIADYWEYDEPYCDRCELKESEIKKKMLM
jgi:hypothetical protein